ncbi:GNAT family N-acetyltransferase [Streptacidiphilus sp. EB129]|uniref:GNAT family N-acetyltransferase n=1 Tax=Streptacidiphilus sp. EB129 TaxID=3156262 RepID=UPI0035111248
MPIIRPYRSADREALYEICVRTGDAGRDATALYRQPRILPDIFTGPYLLLEPELAFVLADAADRPVGYVLGTADTPAFVARFRGEWLPAVAAGYPAPTAEPAPGDLDAHRIRELHDPEWMLTPLLADYPAHLHIDLLPEAQGRGAGRAMIDTYFAALRGSGVSRVHLGMSAANAGARAFYDRLGFHEISRTGAAVLLGRGTHPTVPARPHG